MTKEEEGLLHFSCNPSIFEYFLSLFCICGDLMEELKTFVSLNNTLAYKNSTERFWLDI